MKGRIDPTQLLLRIHNLLIPPKYQCYPIIEDFLRLMVVSNNFLDLLLHTLDFLQFPPSPMLQKFKVHLHGTLSLRINLPPLLCSLTMHMIQVSISFVLHQSTPPQFILTCFEEIIENHTREKTTIYNLVLKLTLIKNEINLHTFSIIYFFKMYKLKFCVFS